MRLNYPLLRKLTGQVHLWLGLASGIVIMILGATGCIYTFIDELRPMVYHDRMFIETPPPGKAMLPLQELKTKAQQALQAQLQGDINIPSRRLLPVQLAASPPLMDVEIFRDRRHSMVFRYRERNDSANWYPEHFISYYRIYINPYTGAIVQVENTKWEFFNVVVMLHCTLLLGYLGKQIITWSTIIFMLMLVSGLILWWPRNSAAAKKRFSFTWKAGSSWRRKNYDLHQVAGFYTCVISFFVALSGLSMILPKLDAAVQYIANAGMVGRSTTMLHTSHMGGTRNQAEAAGGIWNAIAAHAETMNPGASEYRIFSPKTKSDPIIIKNFKNEGTHYAYLQDSYSQSDARHVATTLFSDLSRGDKIHELTYDIHVGALLGIPGKILVFLASFITASLPITGFLIWRGRRKKLQQQ